MSGVLFSPEMRLRSYVAERLFNEGVDPTPLLADVARLADDLLADQIDAVDRFVIWAASVPSPEAR